MNLSPAAKADGGVVRVTAAAKVNLYLHVTGRRADGYHTLDSLVAFCGIGDAIDSLTAQKRLAAAGFGLALMPRSDVDEELASGQLGVIAVGDLDAAQPVVAVVRRNGFLSRAARTLLEDLSRGPRGPAA